MNANDASTLWILGDDGRTPEPVPIAEFERWLAWMHTHDRRVRLTVVAGVTVSTAFLGTALPDWPSGYALFETMFADRNGQPLYIRDRTWDEAEQTHALVVGALRQEGAVD
jgi:hypothetical protein